MRIYLISIILHTITTANSSNTKYIDLLPEKEKQDFLEKIARRILEEVRTKDDRPRASSEIPDEQLNEQDAFVQRILKEETENLRRQFNDTEGKSDKNNNIARISPEEEKNKEQHVDLTFRSKRESLRKVFTGFSPDNDNSTNDSKESDVDIQAKNFRRTNTPDKTNIFENTEVATNIDDIANDTTTEENKTTIQDHNTETEAITQNHDNQLETETTTQDNLNNSSIFTDKEKSNEEMENETTADNQQETKENETTKQDSYHDLPTDETASEPVQLEEIQKTYEHIYYNNSEKTKENENAVSAEVTKTPKNTKRVLRSSTVLDIDPNGTKAKELKDSEVINIQITPVQITEDVTSTTNNENTNKNQTSTENTIDITTEESKTLTPSAETKDRSSKERDTRNIILISKTEEVENKLKRQEKKLNNTKKPKSLQNKLNSTLKSTESKLFTSAVIKALKLKLLEKNNKSDKNINYKTSHHSKTKQNYVHEVFEISPDESPFVIQKARNEPKYQQPAFKQTKFLQPDRKQPKPKQPVVAEAPYHVPIYNYLPNNAFYNPHNVLGPNPANDGDDNDDEGIWIQNDEGYKFPSFMPKSVTKLKQKEKLETVEQPYHVPVYYYSPKNAYYNPNNYYGPNLQNSNEKLDENDKYDDNDDYYIDKTDTNKERDQVEWQHYYDPLKSVKESPVNKKTNKAEAIELNLPKSVVEYITKNTKIDLKAYIDANYSKKRKYKRRCNYKKCHNSKSNLDQSEENESGNDVDENEDGRFMPMMDNVSKMRHIMAEAKHFMMVQPANTSKYDAYLEVKEPNSTRSGLRSLPIYYEDVFNRDIFNQNYDQGLETKLRSSQENNNDYDSAEKNPEKSKYNNYNKAEIKLPADPKHHKNDAIKLIYYKNPTKNDRLKDKSDPFKILTTKYRTSKKESYKNSKLEEFIQLLKKESHKTNKLEELIRIINKAHKYAKTKESPEIVKPILKYSTKENQREEDMIIKLSHYIRDEEIIKLYITLEKIENMEKEKQAQRSDVIKNELIAYEEVLRDMLKENNKGLENYNWLGTAVDLQSAIKKMADMLKVMHTLLKLQVEFCREHENTLLASESVQRDGDLHPSDWELFKYIIYLQKTAQEEISRSFSGKGLRGIAIPRGKRGRHVIKNLMKESLGMRGSGDGLQSRDGAGDELEEFGRFLEELQTGLYDLHTAIKYIAMVTKYNSQHWFENLKQIHVSSKRKPILELLLHICTTRLLGLIEESASEGLEDSFLDYLEKNEKEVDRTREEFVFVLKLLDELKRVK